MTQTKALRLALEALEFDSFYATGKQEAITAIKAALEAKYEPIEFFDWYDNAHWGNEDFKEGCHRAWNAAIKYTARPNQEANDEPWEKFCDSHCVWTDHHPDCKLAKDEPVAYVPYGVFDAWLDQAWLGVRCLNPQLCDPDKVDVQPIYAYPNSQRQPLTDDEIHQIFIANSVVVDNGNAYMVAGLRALNITRAIEAAHGITGENK